jgi:hypothetical protein
MGEGVSVDGVSGSATCLNFLGDALRMGQGEDTELGEVPKRVRQVVEKL